MLDTLAPREKKVLELRFGIVDGRTRTLEEVGKDLRGKMSWGTKVEEL